MYPESQLAMPFDADQVRKEGRGQAAKDMLLDAIAGTRIDPKYDGELVARIKRVDPDLLVIRPAREHPGNIYRVEVPEDCLLYTSRCV